MRSHYLSKSRGTQALTEADLRSRVPSIFAPQPVSNLSERYTFFPTASILNGFQETGWLPVEAFQQRVRLESREGFQKHVLRFARLEHLADWNRNSLRPEIVLLNSHDGSCAYQILAGIFRLICGNGLIVADAVFDRIRVRHSGHSTSEVVEASQRLFREVPTIMNRVQEFQAVLLSETERLEFATQAVNLRWESLEKAPVAPAFLLRPRRIGDDARDLWTTLNTIQENTVMGGQRDRSRRNASGRSAGRSRTVVSIDENLRLNTGLWAIAESLKQEKQG
jgi:hypothetical protein